MLNRRRWNPIFAVLFACVLAVPLLWPEEGLGENTMPQTEMERSYLGLDGFTHYIKVEWDDSGQTVESISLDGSATGVEGIGWVCDGNPTLNAGNTEIVKTPEVTCWKLVYTKPDSGCYFYNRTCVNLGGKLTCF